MGTVLGRAVARKTSSESKLQAVVAEATQPFQPRKENEGIARPVNHQRPDQELEKACDCYPWPRRIRKNGGSRRSLVRFTIEGADWEKMMRKRLRVDHDGMFVEVMGRVHEKLTDFPSSSTAGSWPGAP